MAKYYFCNGTKKDDLPCQLAVPEERDKCHFHDGGGGPGPKRVALSIFSNMKGAIDVMVYAHAAIEASKFFFSLSEHGINIFSELAGYNAVSFEEDNLSIQAKALSDYYEINEVYIVDRISKKTEKDLRSLSAISSLILVALSEDNEQHIDDDHDEGYAVAY